MTSGLNYHVRQLLCITESACGPRYKDVHHTKAAKERSATTHVVMVFLRQEELLL